MGFENKWPIIWYLEINNKYKRSKLEKHQPSTGQSLKLS